MDRKTAFGILGLPPQANSRQVKAAFRAEAKIWHPDRFAGDPEGARRAEARMKEINAAFMSLKPLLAEPAKQEPECNAAEAESHVRKRNPKTEPVKEFGVFSSFRTFFKKQPGRTREQAKVRSRKMKVDRKMKAAPKKQRDFKSVFNRVAPGLHGSACREGRAVRRPAMPYDNYRRYMALKKRMKSVQQRSQEGGIGRVEKISPVRRVDGLGE
ncbi:MAG: DnaJ domain-containing protein [Desulfobacter sp.]|nr:MAG: DnaJ domain-containing protein [Desulfobacter sp.]